MFGKIMEDMMKKMMSGQDKEKMMGKMMENFFENMDSEEKQKLMEAMMQKMMSGCDMMSMMPKMMMNMMGNSCSSDKMPNMPMMPNMVQQMMPKCLAMILPQMEKDQREKFIMEMMTILINHGYNDLTDEDKTKLKDMIN